MVSTDSWPRARFSAPLRSAKLWLVSWRSTFHVHLHHHIAFSLAMSTQNADTLPDSAIRDRIIKHMNADHRDSVRGSAQPYLLCHCPLTCPRFAAMPSFFCRAAPSRADCAHH